MEGQSLPPPPPPRGSLAPRLPESLPLGEATPQVPSVAWSGAGRAAELGARARPGGSPGAGGSAAVGKPQAEVTRPLRPMGVAPSGAAAAVAALSPSSWRAGPARAVGRRGSHRHGVTAALRTRTVPLSSSAAARGYGPPRTRATLPRSRGRTPTRPGGSAAG